MVAVRWYRARKFGELHGDLGLPAFRITHVFTVNPDKSVASPEEGGGL